MTTCSEILLSGSLPTTLTETDGQKMIEKKERSAAAVAAATDSFAVPRFLSAIVLPNEVGLLIHSISPPDAQERRRRRGRKKGGDGGGGRSPVAVVCRRAKRREGSYMWVKKQERKFLVLAFCRQCFLSKKSRRRAATRSQRARQTTSRLICHLQQGG